MADDLDIENAPEPVVEPAIEQAVEPVSNVETVSVKVDDLNSIEDWNQLVQGIENKKIITDEPKEVAQEEQQEPVKEEVAEATETPEAVDEVEDQEEQDKPKRFRVRSKDPVEARALEIKARNPDISLAECITRANQEINPNEPAKETAKKEVKQDTSKQKLEELKKARDYALEEELDFEKAKQLEKQINDLVSKSEVVEEKPSEADAHKDYLDAFEASKNKAVELYDFVTKRGAEAERIEEIDRQLQESGDPLFNDPRKPLILAQMVAKEFSIAPKSSKKPVTAPVQNARPPRKPAIATPATGSARTVQNTQNKLVEDRIDSIKDPLAWEELIAKV